VPTILIARHAQASFGAPDYDVLSATGVEQAHALAADLERRRLRFDRIVSGPAARQRDTAAPIAVAADAPTVVDRRWDEYRTEDILTHHSDTHVRLDAGSGQAAPISSRRFQEVLDCALLRWIAAGAEGPTAEPWPAFAARVEAAFAGVVRDLPRGATALVCTSGGPLAAICVRLLGLPAAALVGFNRVAVNTGVTKAVTGRSGTTLISFNEHGHLEAGRGSLVTYR
jgi:broad specificity phosphatase PhoE